MGGVTDVVGDVDRLRIDTGVQTIVHLQITCASLGLRDARAPCQNWNACRSDYKPANSELQ